MYAYKELRPFMMNPHHQTMIGIQYVVQYLQEKGHEIIVMIDANQPEGKYYQSQLHNKKIELHKAFT
jgi:ATP-dependent RNA circularization protein (DNA/RNA ligase family)